MKRTLSILIILLLCLTVFAGCEKPDSETLIAKHENDCENIDQKLASEIKIAYSQYTNDVNYGGEQRFTPEDIFILRYDGEIGGCHFVMLGGDEIDYTTAFRSVEVAGYVVEFSSGQPMYAYKDGNFHTLKQAYDNGILTDSDVYEIGIKVDPSFAERYTTPDSISGKRLPIVMTIAETLPSCVAFEYKDGEPYCFYGYDDDGKLYRVLWNNFDGLNEKDRIVVDHNDVIKTLSYDEYPGGGWTPQYEVTAISIYSEAEWNSFQQDE